MPAPRERTVAFMSALWALDHALHRASKQMAASLGVTGPQRLALRVIGTDPAITPGRLARALHLDPSTVSGVLARLDAKGFIQRAEDKDDARRMRILLTPSGRRVYTRTSGTVEAAINRVLAQAGAKDAEAAIRALDAVTALLRKTFDHPQAAAIGSRLPRRRTIGVEQSGRTSYRPSSRAPFSASAPGSRVRS